MRLTITIVSLAIFSLFQLSFAQELHRLGLIESNPKEVKWMQPSPVIASDALPNSFYDPAFLPPVGNQGSQGSCTAWAVAYYFKTYQEAKEKGWDPAMPDHQCSPAFTYNMINGGVDGGSSIADAFLLLEEFGCGTMADMPYFAGNFTNWPAENTFENGIPFRTATTYYIYTRNNAGIDQIKQVLNNGELAVIGIDVYPNFDNIAGYNYTYCVSNVSGSSRGGHAVAIIGYDDNKVTNDGVGAFRMVNSWGAGWGQQGFWWMSYEAVKSSIICHGYAYYANDRIGYTPKLLARYQLSHNRRGTVDVKVGVGTTLNSLWEQTFFDFQMRQWRIDNNPYPSTRIVLDATDGVSFLTPASQNNFYINFRDNEYDGVNGTVKFFRGESNQHGLNATATNVPLNMPDGLWTPIGVPIGGALSVFPLLMDFGELTMGSSSQLNLMINNLGASAEQLDLQFENGSSSYFSFYPDNVSLTSGDSQAVTVSYEPPVQSTDKASIAVSGSEYLTNVRLKGTSTGTLALLPGQFDFGQVNVGDSVSQQFTIRNQGTFAAQLNTAITGENAANFKVNPAQLSIVPGDSQYVNVTFRPLAAEDKHAFLEISAAGQVHHSELRGFGIGAPQLQLPVSAVTKSVLVGDSMVAILPLENSGTAFLSYAIDLQFNGGDSSWAVLQNPSGNISPGGSQKILIHLRGLTESVNNAECRITTNEAGAPSYSIPLELKTVNVSGQPHFVSCFSGSPFEPMQFRIVHAEWGNTELEAGDEIALYDGNLCVGTARISCTIGNGPCALNILTSADDPATPALDGFQDGHTIDFRIWDTSDSLEHQIMGVEFTTTGGQPIPPPPFTNNGMATVMLGTVTSVDEPAAENIPVKFELNQNYPNPFNPMTTIGFALPEQGRVHLTVYNNIGQRVTTLVDNFYTPGEYEISWNGTSANGQQASSGIYIYRLQFTGKQKNFNQVRKMLLIR